MGVNVFYCFVDCTKMKYGHIETGTTTGKIVNVINRCGRKS